MKKGDNHCDLNSCILCKGCISDWLPAVESHRKNISFKKGELIFREGEQAKGIYFLYSGKVKVHQQWGKDKQLILHFAKKGDIIGYRGLGNEKVYPVTATTLEPTVVCFADIPFFETTLKVNQQLTYQFMQFFASELQEAERRMRNLAHMEVKGRVAEMLLMLEKNFGTNEQGDIDITLTRQDLASYAGTSYETFFRTINDLVKEGILKADGKQIKILKEARLQELTSFN